MYRARTLALTLAALLGGASIAAAQQAVTYKQGCSVLGISGL
jgi:hypothetical protein